jgi:hypothetical protein
LRVFYIKNFKFKNWENCTFVQFSQFLKPAELFSSLEISYIAGRSELKTLTSARLIRHYEKIAKDFKNIVATKEASGNLEQIMKVIKNKPKDFLVISGDDLLTLPMIACGADGVISVVANGFPADFSEMTQQIALAHMSNIFNSSWLVRDFTIFTSKT